MWLYNGPMVFCQGMVEAQVYMRYDFLTIVEKASGIAKSLQL